MNYSSVLLVAEKKTSAYIGASVAGDILVPWSILVAYTLFLCLLKEFVAGFKTPADLPFSAALTIVTGFLLVFRTNGAYDRFWEGRKYWDTINNITKSLARLIVIGIKDKGQVDTMDDKAKGLSILQDFPYQVMIKLRKMHKTANQHSSLGLWKKKMKKTDDHSSCNDVILCLKEDDKIDPSRDPMLSINEIALLIQRHRVAGNIDPPQASSMDNHLTSLSACISGCERISNTPVPRAYTIHLEQMLWVYCLTFPFMILDKFGFWTILVSAIVYYVILGVYAIGGEIENPFGLDHNDLPLEHYCEKIKNDIEILFCSLLKKP